jgi:uncharacterized protein (DUF2235 family)
MPKRLVVCCDGTWNKPDQLHDGVPAPTNVSKLALAVARSDEEGVEQRVRYVHGVGTRRFERVRGGAFGVGLSRNVREGYRFLVDSYEPGDELFFFGFSRGAFTARSTVGLVRNAGILCREHAERVDEAYALYRARDERTRPNGVEAQLFRRMYSHPDCDIHFVGVWDTVGALGIPIDGFRLPLLTRRWSFHDTALSSHVRCAHHAIAIDEQRGPFKPTLWQQQAHAEGQTLEQVFFAGVHCDVGGGYSDPSLGEIPLLWMVDRARAAGLAFDPERLALVEPAAADPKLRAEGIQVAPDACGQIHESRKGFYKLMRRHQRTLEADGGAVASSAIRRRSERSDYDPPGLAEYGGPTVTVVDRPATPASDRSR